MIYEVTDDNGKVLAITCDWVEVKEHAITFYVRGEHQNIPVEIFPIEKIRRVSRSKP